MKYLSCLLKQSNPEWADRLPQVWLEYEKNDNDVVRIVHDIDRLECLHQALIYRKRYRGKHDLNEFRTLRDKISDKWLSAQANQIIEEWDALDQGEASKTDIIFMIGGPGVGKGTQCAKIIQDFNVEHISVGELLREEQKNPNSVFGEFIKESIANSVIVPPPLSIMLLKSRIQAIQAKGKGVLIDGFPRSIGQAVAFEQEISDKYSTIALDCSPEAMRERVKVRAQTSGRDDDNANSMEKRLKTFNDSNREVLEHLSHNCLRKVDASGNDVEVYEAVKKTIEEIISS